MISFKTSLEKFDSQGEKTGWTYIRIPAKIAQKVKPDQKKAFRVKGKLDDFPINAVSLLPMGEGDFILAVNAGMRKGIRKRKGDTVQVQLEEDKQPLKLSADLLQCLPGWRGSSPHRRGCPRS